MPTNPDDRQRDTANPSDAPSRSERERSDAAADTAPEPDADQADDRADTTGDGASHERALAEQRDRYLRLAAEYDNFRKRSARERAEAGTRAQGTLITPLLDALDDLERFATLDPATTDTGTVVRGVDLVAKKLMKELGGAGLEVLNPVDQQFDPNLHEALATEPAASREDDGLVARVYQPGYLFNGQLLRPARVVVRQWAG